MDLEFEIRKVIGIANYSKKTSIPKHCSVENKIFKVHVFVRRSTHPPSCSNISSGKIHQSFAATDEEGPVCSLLYLMVCIASNSLFFLDLNCGKQTFFYYFYVYPILAIGE